MKNWHTSPTTEILLRVAWESCELYPCLRLDVPVVQQVRAPNLSLGAGSAAEQYLGCYDESAEQARDPRVRCHVGHVCLQDALH